MGDQRHASGCRLVDGCLAYVITDAHPARLDVTLADGEDRTLDLVLED